MCGRNPRRGQAGIAQVTVDVFVDAQQEGAGQVGDVRRPVSRSGRHHAAHKLEYHCGQAGRIRRWRPLGAVGQLAQDGRQHLGQPAVPGQAHRQQILQRRRGDRHDVRRQVDEEHVHGPVAVVVGAGVKRPGRVVERDVPSPQPGRALPLADHHAAVHRQDELVWPGG